MKNKIYILLSFLWVSVIVEAQNFKNNCKTDLLWKNYDSYTEKTITNRFIKHKDVVELIEKHTKKGIFKNEILGNSVEGRSINHLSIGKGKIKVMLWSQMHGDESTATMALFDIFNFLDAKDDNDAFRKYLLDHLEIHFIPMLNPDGAEVWKRRNSFGIDINRDALALVTPEANILKTICKKVKPDFGYNLHDQSSLYSIGHTKEPAAISFLAPAFDYEQTENVVRKKAIKLIANMNSHLQNYIPGKVSRYNDEFEPRAFGDNFQSWGVSTILIESGGYKDDIEKQFIRKLNFYTILQSFESICDQSYQKENEEDYFNIKVNSRFNYDLVIRNLGLSKNLFKFKTDIGVNQEQILNSDLKSVSFRGTIAEIGDMHNNFGYENFDANGMDYMVPKIKIMTQKEWGDLTLTEEFQLAQQGYLYVKITDRNNPNTKNRILQLTENETIVNNNPETRKAANFILVENSKPRYAVINGFFVDLSKEPKVFHNIISN
jgi:hypothetical protein